MGIRAALIIALIVLAITVPAMAASTRVPLTASVFAGWTKGKALAYIDRMMKAMEKSPLGWYNALSNEDRTNLLMVEAVAKAWADKYPKDRDLPFTLYRVGFLLRHSGLWEERAAQMFHFLIARYPTSDHAARARVDLREMGY